MVEQERIHTSQQAGDPLPASMPGILVCEQCSCGTWRAAALDETSIIYHCVGCNAGVRIVYDTATRSWKALALPISAR
jgi:hypothetical protein